MSLIQVANGKAAKLIIPTDAVEAVKKSVVFSETSGIGSVTKEGTEEPAPVVKDVCCDE